MVITTYICLGRKMMTTIGTTLLKCTACGLFGDMNQEEIASALACFHARVTEYEKGAVILHAGDRTRSLALVLDGSVTIQSDDFWGNRTILTMIGAGGLFAETYALLHETLLVDAVANTRSRSSFSTSQSSTNFQKRKIRGLCPFSRVFSPSPPRKISRSRREVSIRRRRPSAGA